MLCKLCICTIHECIIGAQDVVFVPPCQPESVVRVLSAAAGSPESVVRVSRCSSWQRLPVSLSTCSRAKAPLRTEKSGLESRL